MILIVVIVCQVSDLPDRLHQPGPAYSLLSVEALPNGFAHFRVMSALGFGIL